MSSAHSINFPQKCTVCYQSSGKNIVPDRSIEADYPNFQYEVLCDDCFETFISIFPIRPRDFYVIETTGKKTSKKDLRCLRLK